MNRGGHHDPGFAAESFEVSGGAKSSNLLLFGTPGFASQGCVKAGFARSGDMDSEVHVDEGGCHARIMRLR